MPKMSLGQATGGKPGRVQAKAPQQAPKVAARGRPMPSPPKTGPLGLGLGLNARQRAGFQQAAQGQGGMGSAQWLAQHPQVQQRIANMGGAQGQKVQNFMQSGQRLPAPPPASRQAPGAQPAPQRPPMPLGMVGGNVGQPGGPQGNMAFFGPQGSNMPRPMVNPGMQSVMQDRGMPPSMMYQQPQQPQFDQQAIQANPQGFQQWQQQAQQREQQMPGSTMLSQRPSMGFGGGPGYSLGGQPPPGMGTGFGMGQPQQSRQPMQGFGGQLGQMGQQMQRPPQGMQGFGGNPYGAM